MTQDRTLQPRRSHITYLVILNWVSIDMTDSDRVTHAISPHQISYVNQEEAFE